MLVYAGIILMAAAVAAGAVTAVLAGREKKKLEKELEAEYGPRRSHRAS